MSGPRTNSGNGNAGGAPALAPQVARHEEQGGRDSFPALLNQSKSEIGKLLVGGMDLDRVLRVALTTWKMDPKIQGCTPRSVLAAVMKAVELGFEPGGALKHCYLIPYGQECEFRISYFGYLELARRSGEFKLIEARIVHQNDVFQYEYSPDLTFKHKPDLFNPGAVVGAYCYAKMANGELAVEWMTKGELDKVAALPKAGPVWKTWFEEMSKKAVLRRFLKKQRLSVQLAEASDDEDAREKAFGRAYGFAGAVPGGGDVPLSLSRADALAGRLGAPYGPGYAGEVEAEYEDQSAGVTDPAGATQEPGRGREPGEDG